MQTGHSVYSHHANDEIAWLPMDTEELYHEHLGIPDKRAQLEQLNWIDADITYKFNAQGFCSEDFGDRPAAAFFGCSFTLGVGIPLHTRWPTIVSKELGLACYNLGIAGASNDTAFRMAYSWLHKLKPQLVVFCTTFSHRFEVFAGQGFTGRSLQFDGGTFEHEWMGNPVNCELNKAKNKLAVAQLCSEMNIKFIATEVEKLEVIDLARDLSHPGVLSNKKFADYVLSLIKT